jgi:DNA-binding LytR/AlgR family response regulator
MQDLKILIVEDDILLAEGIAEDLREFGYSITDIAHNSRDALKAFRKRLPDLVLMDIHLEESEIDGIELARIFNNILKVPIIFLTAIGGQETVKRAKQVKPSYYLIKPCNKRQLLVAIDFAISNFTQQNEAKIEHSLRFQIAPSCVLYSTQNFFFVKKGIKYVRVEIANIIYVKSESPGSNVRIITENDSLFLSVGLKSFLKQTPHPSLVRLNRSYVVNLNKIIAFDTGRVFVNIKEEQLEIPIGGSYREQIQHLFPRLKAD